MAGRAPTSLRHCLRQKTSHSRTFTSSCRRPGVGLLASFPPSSSPELDTFLSSVRKDFFVQTHLRPMHRELVCRKKLHHFITGDEQVIVPLRTVDAVDSSKKANEEFLLSPVNVFTEKPARQIFTELLRLANTKEDWTMIPAFLREFRNSGRKIKQMYVSKLIRTAAKKGHFGAVIEMMRMCEETGLYLNTKETALEVMLLCVKRAIAGEWSEKEVTKASRHADSAMWLMIQPLHAPHGVKNSAATHPEVIGAALALSAIKSKFHDFKDEDGKVLKYSQDFINTLPKEDSFSATFDETIHGEANRFLAFWTPTWLGTQLAQKIIPDIEVLKTLEDVGDKLRTQLLLAADVVGKGPNPEMTRGMEIYREMSKQLES